jgi:type IV pilus assembly protein PilM
MTAYPGLLQRMRSWLDAPPEVPLACEIAAEYVAAVRHRHGRIEAWAIRPLPSEAVRPAPLAENIAQADAVREALEQTLGTVADGDRRCALVVPDIVARVTLLEFDQVPENVDEADSLIRWRLSRDLPFEAQQAVLAFARQPGRNGAQEVLVAAALRSVVREYEASLERLGLQVGEVTLATLAALGCLTRRAAPRLLVKRDRGSLGLAIQDGPAVRLFRSLPLPHGAGLRSEEEIAEKAYPAIVYFQDQWQQALEEVVVTGSVKATPSLLTRLQQEAGCAARELAVGDFELPPSPQSGAAADERLLPLLGWAREEAG